MTKEQKEGNKIIAEFLGGTVISSYREIPIWKGDIVREFRKMDNISDWDTISLRLCSFHESWDWIMPVVRKFFNLDLFQHPAYVEITDNLQDTLSACNIDYVFDELVAGILWYNEKIKTNI